MDATNTLVISKPPEPNVQVHTFLSALPATTRLLIKLMYPGKNASAVSLEAWPLSHDLAAWDELIRLGRKHGGMPLVYKAFKLANLEQVPAEIKSRLQADFHRIGLLISMQTEIMKQVTASFEAADIPLIFFKGIQLGEEAYGNPIWRKPGDLDVLIHEENFKPARQILFDLGFDTRKNALQEKAQIQHQQQLTFYGNTTDVDVHFSLEQRSFLKMSYAHTESRGIWKRARQTNLKGFNIPSLSPEDQFCLLCVHSAKHGWYRLYMLSDIAAFISNVQMNWQKVAIRIKRMKAERMLGLSVLLSHYLFDTPIPVRIKHIVEKDTQLPALSLQVLRRLLDEDAENQAILFHRIQTSLFPRWSEKARYFRHLTAEHWKRKTARFRR